MTSLEMPGFSITILKLDKELEKYLEFKAETPAYKNWGEISYEKW